MTCSSWHPVLLALALLGYGAAAAAVEPPRIQTIVVNVESLMPADLARGDRPLPTLNALRSEGTWYTESRGVFPSNSLNGHASLLTGTYPETHGIIDNNYWSRRRNEPPRSMARPSLLEAPTLALQLHQACPELRVGVAHSDPEIQALYSACGPGREFCSPFSRQPAREFHPGAHPDLDPALGHVPDRATMAAAISYLRDVDVLFIGLSQLDSNGHLDARNADGEPGSRGAVLSHIDDLLGLLVEALVHVGRYHQSVILVTSNHGMQWSDPALAVPTGRLLEEAFPGRFLIVGGGGSQSLYLRQRRKPESWQAAREALQLLRLHPGVGNVWLTTLHSAAVQGLTRSEMLDLLPPRALRMRHRRAGEVRLVAAAGHQLAHGDAGPSGLSGSHGGLDSLHNTLLISGGLPFLQAQSITAPAQQMDAHGRVDARIRLPGQAETVDIAPTLAWLYGLPLQHDAAAGNADPGPVYEGRPLREAFLPGFAPAPGDCGALPHAPLQP